jgi:hypothetical protein
MEYRFELFPHPSYLHVRATGTHNRANTMRFMEESHRECVARGYDALLIEQALEGPSLGPGGIFKIVQARLDTARTLRRIAYVDTHGRIDGRKFVEDVARNRGINVRAFASVDDAKLWLEG